MPLVVIYVFFLAHYVLFLNQDKASLSHYSISLIHNGVLVITNELSVAKDELSLRKFGALVYNLCLYVQNLLSKVGQGYSVVINLQVNDAKVYPLVSYLGYVLAQDARK